MRNCRYIFLLLAIWIAVMPRMDAIGQSSHMVAPPARIPEAAERPDRSSRPPRGNHSQELLSAMAMSDADSLRRLLENGANANYTDPGSGATLLMIAQHPVLVQVLLQHGADPLALDRKGATALHYAVLGSRALEIIPLLVEKGADVNARDEKGFSVLMLAVMNDKPELVSLIIKLGADLQVRTKDGQTALDWAQDLGFADIVDMLEDAALKQSPSPLLK